jgi:hypothetical protein
MRQFEVNKLALIMVQPPEGYADASPAPTVELYSAQNAAVQASTNATRGTAAAVATIADGSDSASCDTVANFKIGMPVWVATTGGRGYEDLVVDINSSTKVLTLGQKARFAVASGSIKDHSLAYSFAALSNAVVRRNCRVVFRYSVGGVSRSLARTVDFVRFPFALPITESDVEKVSATFGLTGGSKGEYLRYLEQAESDIAMMLRGQQIQPDLCMERDLLCSAAVYRVLQLRNITKGELSERFSALFSEQMAAFLTSRTWYDSDEDMVQTPSGNGTLAPPGGSSSNTANQIGPKYALVS